jgi:hypothetical protein
MRDPNITQAERDWHRTRRMFVFHNNKLIIAGLLDDRGHREWFASEGWAFAYEHDVRGFYDETGVYLYRGADYRCDAEVEQTVEYDGSLFEGIVAAGTPIYGGMVPGEMGVRWQPIKQLGVVP